jgi:hypothetical protein
MRNENGRQAQQRKMATAPKPITIVNKFDVAFYDASDVRANDYWVTTRQLVSVLPAVDPIGYPLSS